jgi:hypothetical protein
MEQEETRQEVRQNDFDDDILGVNEFMKDFNQALSDNGLI